MWNMHKYWKGTIPYWDSFGVNFATPVFFPHCQWYICSVCGFVGKRATCCSFVVVHLDSWVTWLFCPCLSFLWPPHSSSIWIWKHNGMSIHKSLSNDGIDINSDVLTPFDLTWNNMFDDSESSLIINKNYGYFVSLFVFSKM